MNQVVSQECAPCSWSRSLRLVYLPFTLQHLFLPSVPILLLKSVTSEDLVVVLYFSLLALASVSLLYVVFTDPGGVPTEWDQAVRETPHPAYVMCANTGMYKPPRAHFDVVTGRVVLNFDHFCPWVMNSIGYRNRKFFVLFLLYMCGTTVTVLTILGPGAAAAMSDEGRVSLCWISLLTLWCVATHALVIAPLLLFAGAHVYMVCANQTSIEDSQASRPYDRGVWNNVQTVFGDRWYWWLTPLWCGGPRGDGIHWEGVDGAVYGRAQPGRSSDLGDAPLLAMHDVI